MRKKRSIGVQVRRDVCLRYGAGPGKTVRAQCAYCAHEDEVTWYRTYPVLSGLLEYDHIIPESKGGATNAENLTLSCRPCNRRKGALTNG